jgi:hypothetical protein
VVSHSDKPCRRTGQFGAGLCSDCKPNIEQDRRDFKRLYPDLYEYIEAVITAQVFDRAGDRMSSRNQFGAANLCWSWSGDFQAVVHAMRSRERAGNITAVTREDTP